MENKEKVLRVRRPLLLLCLIIVLCIFWGTNGNYWYVSRGYYNFQVWENPELENVDGYLNHPSAIKEIKDILKRDADDKSTQYGGVIYLVEENRKKYFKYIEIPSINSKIYKEIANNRENPKELERVLDNNLFLLKTEPEERFFRLYQTIKKQKSEKRNYLIKMILNPYFAFSDFNYTRQEISGYYPYDVDGQLVGSFHIHIHGNGIDQLDEALQGMRDFVFVNKGDFVVVYEIVDGKKKSETIIYLEKKVKKIPPPKQKNKKKQPDNPFEKLHRRAMTV